MRTRKRRRLAAGAIVAVMAGCALSAVAVSAAPGDGGERVVTRSTPQPAAKQSARVPRTEPLAAPRRACDAGCLKRKLKALTRRHNQLAAAFNSLAFDYYECEQLAPVTSYFGYQYDDGGGTFSTSALDYTDSGDTPDDYMVVYVC